MISIVIPARNESGTLDASLVRIKEAAAKAGGEWELIVADNDSTDNTAEIAAQQGATVVCEPTRQISAVRNAGAKVASGEWLLFIDADSYPTDGLLEEVLQLVAADEHIGCGTTIQVEGGTLFNKLRLERMNPFYRLFRLSGGAFLLAKRQAFEAVHGFSTALYALEEIDFIVRLKRLGRKQGKRFSVLYRHPVITSGRKGEYRLGSILRLFVSNFAAVFYFLLALVLPKRWVPKPPRFLLSYWYH